MSEPAGDNAHSEVVAEALKSGKWKEKNDPRSGRKYYVHAETKRSIWADKFEKELTKDRKDTPTKPQVSARSLREERHEKARRRAEAEAQLKEKIATMEQSKVELETEIARLKAPVEQETAQLNEMRRSLGDKKFSLQIVETEVVEKRKARDAELRALLDKVRSLQSVVDSEKTYRETVEAKHRQLVVEALELKSDLQREEAAAESLRVAVRSAELKLDEAKAHMSKQKTEVQHREELVRKAEEELRFVAKKKSELETSIEQLKKEKELLTERASRMKRVASSVAHEGGEVAVQRLAEQYNKKAKQIEQLSKRQSTEEDVVVLEHSTMKLRQLITSAQKDRTALEAAAKLLVHESRRIGNCLAECRADAQELSNTLYSLRKEAWKQESTL